MEQQMRNVFSVSSACAWTISSKKMRSRSYPHALCMWMCKNVLLFRRSRTGERVREWANRRVNEHNCTDEPHAYKEKSERHYATPQEIKCVREIIGRKWFKHTYTHALAQARLKARTHSHQIVTRCSKFDKWISKIRNNPNNPTNNPNRQQQ